MTQLSDEELKACEITNQLFGLPTVESLKEAYLQYNFDRKAVAEHFNISTQRLNQIKKKLLGPQELPSSPSYIRQWNEVRWYTRVHPEWTHVPTATEEEEFNFKYK